MTRMTVYVNWVETDTHKFCIHAIKYEISFFVIQIWIKCSFFMSSLRYFKKISFFVFYWLLNERVKIGFIKYEAMSWEKNAVNFGFRPNKFLLISRTEIQKYIFLESDYLEKKKTDLLPRSFRYKENKQERDREIEEN